MSEVASSSKELLSLEGDTALPSPGLSQSQRQGKNSSVDEDEDSYWKGELEKWRASGLKQVDYCRKHNLNYNVFRRWKRKLCKYNNSSESDTSITLVQVGGALNFKSPFGPFPPSVGSSSSSLGYLRSSGIRFWLGEFCIEVEEKFSSSSLAQLIRILRSV